MKLKKILPDESNSEQPKSSLPNCVVKTSVRFERKSKRLYRKYASLESEVGELIEELQTNPTKGTPIGNSCYKIRLAIKSKGKGKSGGARVITYYYIHGEIVYLLSIYDKSEQENIPDGMIAELLQDVEELE